MHKLRRKMLCGAAALLACFGLSFYPVFRVETTKSETTATEDTTPPADDTTPSTEDTGPIDTSVDYEGLADDFLAQYPVLTKEYADVGASDLETLEWLQAEYEYFDYNLQVGLDIKSYAEDYGAFSDMLLNRVHKADYENTRKAVLEDLSTILRGCDGQEVRAYLAQEIAYIQTDTYDENGFFDQSVNYYEEKTTYLLSAAAGFEDMRAIYRGVNQMEERYQAYEKGEYSSELLSTLRALADGKIAQMKALTPKSENISESVRTLLEEGFTEMEEAVA